MTASRIVLASNNAGKVREINEVLSDHALTVMPQSEFFITEAEETGASFIENALIKARYAAFHTGLPAIADDSGIEVNALNGQPGIYSGRFAGMVATDQANLHKLTDAITDFAESQRKARYVCVMVYMRHADDPVPLISQGFWEGSLVTEPRGENGFGYDPMFYVPEHQCTAAQLSPDLKNRMSHRGKALRKLVKLIRNENE